MPERVHRYDAGDLLSAQRTPEGYILAEGRMAKPGILVYRTADGRTRRELLPREELFRSDSLATLGRKPVTLEHPPLDDSGNAIWVGPDNVAVLGVGDVDGEIVEEEGGFVRVKMAVRRADAIDAVEKGKRGLSPGYTCRIDETPGTWQGQPYDAVQRDRRYNHLAICDLGRGGPEVRLRLDSADAVQVHDGPTAGSKEKPTMSTASIEIGGVRFDVDAGLAQAFSTAIEAARNDAATLKAQLDALKKSYDAKCGEKDAMDAEMKTIKDQMAEIEARMKEKEAKNGSGGAGESEPEKKGDADDFLARFAVRRDLLATAERVGVERCDSMPDAELRRAIVAADNPEIKTDSLSEDYLAGYIARLAGQHTRADSSTAAVGAATKPPQGAEAPKDFEARRADAQRAAIEDLDKLGRGALA